MLTARDGRPPNIRAGDFFSAIAEGLSCEVVVGNPPWVQIPNLGTLAALNYERSHRHDAPIGDRQSAELFTWKALNEHLVQDGVLAFLLPLKSLVNRLSSGFARGLRNQCEIVGVSDLAHLRYVLFRRSGATPAAEPGKKAARGARQSTAAVLLRKREAGPDHQFWTFRPLRPTQPATRKGRLWTLIHDWTQVQWSLQAELDDAQWIQVFTCSTVDRRILRHIDRQARSGRLETLGALKDRYGLEFRIEVDKNLDRAFVLGTDERSPKYWLTQLGLLDPPLGLANAPSAVPLPRAQVDKGIPSVRAFLQGNLVVMSRNCERAVFVEPPAAFSFLVLAGFPAYAGEALPRAHRQFMQALAAYMSTDVFRYLCFVSSPRMMIDRASIELSTVRQQPWPLGAPGDDRIEAFLSADAERREVLALQALGVPDILGRAISEFGTLREAYRDGGSPPEGLRGAQADELTAYAETVLAEVDRGKGRYRTSLTKIDGASLTALTLTYVGDDVASPTAASAVERALREYQAEGASSLSQTRYLWHSRDDMQTVLLKPAERLHWTRDRAFGDADLITAAMMSRAFPERRESGRVPRGVRV